MTFNLHPSAITNYNKKAIELTLLIEEIPIDVSNRKDFPSDLHISSSITDKDIIGEVHMSSSDYKGNIIERYFQFNGKRYGLCSEKYKKLKEIAEKIQAQPVVRKILSRSFIEKTLFSWICNKYKKSDIIDSFIEYLEFSANEIVKEITSWIPIANLEVQTSFPFSRSEIRPLSKSIIDNWEIKMCSPSNKNKEQVTELFKQIRAKYQGLAAVVTKINAEPDYAFDYSMEEANKAASILGIFSSAVLVPDIKCSTKVKGSEFIAQGTSINEVGETGFQMISRILDQSAAVYRRLSTEEISYLRIAGLDKISSLLSSDSLKEFEEAVLNSILMYSKSAFTSDPIEKIVYMLSALESIFLKNDNEPIQQNLCERIAMFISKELEERKSIIKTIKAIYGLRSRYLHHGHTLSDMELISIFMKHVWVIFVQLIADVHQFNTRLEFIDALDDHKLA
jgi:hypothetical protein